MAMSVERKYDFKAILLKNFNDDPAILRKFTNLKYLSTAPEFNRDFGDNLPGTLISLELGWKFKQRLILKPGLQRLIIRGEFDASLILPPGIKYVSIRGHFRQPVVLPDSVEEFELGYFYDHPTVIPANVRSARFGSLFRQEIRLSPKMQTLRLSENYRVPYCLRKSIMEQNVKLTRYRTSYTVRDQFVIGEL